MPQLNDTLAALLGTVRTPGDFYASGVCALHPPGLRVDGVGTIALPLLPVQAEALIEVAERAPYGQGAKTLIDTAVRRTWQIGADRVHIEGRRYADTLAAIVAQASAGLGAGGGVVAELYKLLIYDAGSFFVSHRDTEKSPGMFATLIVALPSLHAGGELRVRHQGREARLGLHCDDPADAAYAAFYADCVHEVLPVTSGYRLALVYNLLRKGPGKLPRPPQYEAQTAALTALLADWGDASPDKLVYPLAHAYTPAGLSFQALKGADAAAATVLLSAARQAGCDLHLALMQIEESGWADYSGGFGSGRYRRHADDDDEEEDEADDAEFEVGEVTDRSLLLSAWTRPDGGAAGFGNMAFSDEEVCPADALGELDPDTEHFQEATGNEGASFERSYRRAALVAWPQARRLALLAQAGPASALPYLAGLATAWTRAAAQARDALGQEAHALAGELLRHWPQHPHADATGQAAPLLAALAQLGDTFHIDAFVAGISAAGRYGKADNAALVDALRLLPAPRAGELLADVIRANADLHIGGCADLLRRAGSGVGFGVGVADWPLHAAARSLVDAMPGDPQRPAAPAEHWHRRERADAAVVADGVVALCGIDADLAVSAANHLLAWPKTYPLDAVVVPALRQLAGEPALRSALREHAAVQRLNTAGLAHLQARVALDLAPPADWRRAAEVACGCAHCLGLRQFLASPVDAAWRFKARQTDRDHVLASIRQGACDLDCTVERKGNPHVLVCTKNQASYTLRVKQRRIDLEDLALLGAFEA